ncbi:retrovirus-related pol polyprotein from transposon TNT 1-94 [Tanacetum coccineum]
MNKELQALEANHTWTLTLLQPDKKAIGCKWVYKIKFHSYGTVDRYKARLVAQGFTQQEGIDCTETFAPIAKMVTVRTLLVVDVHHNWHIAQLDINNAFLHGDLHEEVYMSLPPEYTRNLNYYLGIEFLRNSKGLTMSQRKYALELLQTANVLNLKPCHIPVDPIVKLNDTDGEPLTNPSLYRAIVGKLLYLTITRPDLSYAAHALSQFSHSPRTPHRKALIKVLRYIKLCPGQGLFIPLKTILNYKLIVTVIGPIVLQQEGL